MSNGSKINKELLNKILKGLLEPFSLTNHNWRVAVVCLIAASFFWFFNKLNKYYSTKIDYPVIIAYDSSEVVPLRELPKVVSANVSGNGWDLLKRSFGYGMDPLVLKPKFLPRSNFISSKRLRPILDQEMDALKLNYLETDTLWFFFDSLISKRVPIEVNIGAAKVADGLRMEGQIKTEPDSLLFFGPAFAIRAMPESYLVVLDSTNFINSGFSKKVKINTEGLGEVNTWNRTAMIRVPTVEFISKRKQLPVGIKTPSKEIPYMVLDSLVELTYKIDKVHDDPIIDSSMVAYVDISTVVKGDSIAAICIENVPSEVYDLSYEPEFVEIAVDSSKLDGK